MIKEKHVIKNPYNHHALSRYIDVYEVSANRCQSVPESGYKGTEATLVDEPAWNEKFSSYSITGATLTGNNFILNNDVTAQANYETAKNLTLQTDGHGTIAANKTSGFIGDQVTLSNTADAEHGFSGYSITGATLIGNKFNFIGNDVTAKAWFSALPTSALLESDPYSYTAYKSVPFTIYYPDYEFYAIKYDYTRNSTGSKWNIDRTIKVFGENILTKTILSDYSMVNTTSIKSYPLIEKLNGTYQINQAAIYYDRRFHDSGVYISNAGFAKDTHTYCHCWRPNSTGYVIGIDGVWRYRDNRSNGIGTPYSLAISASGHVTATFGNIRIGAFKYSADAITGNW